MVARTAADTAARVTGAVMKIAGSGAGGGGACTVSAAGRGEAEKIFGSLGHTGREISLHINLANLENECCRSAFLRGLFFPAEQLPIRLVNTIWNLPCRT